ncbi:MAG: hypothetical protein KF836_11435 [Fimbriimonadaceae bacterium]|nr:hypothetical protein [Fimbriimonadaceae bacterium]
MSHEETNIEETVEQSTAQQFVENELASVKKNLQNTQIFGSAFVFGVMCFLFSIANGFATNLEPKEAAKITKGLVVQRLEEAQPQLSSYLKQEIPSFIKQVPEFAKEQMPIIREDLEVNIEAEIEKLAHETSGSLDQALDSFLIEKQDEFKTIILAGQDKETTDEVAAAMRDMFLVYLTENHGEDESIQYKLDQALISLHEIQKKTHRLAYAKDLDAVEKKTRRAIACLFNTVSEHKDAMGLPTQEQAQNTVAGLMDLANDHTPR